jgi:prepilin-type N-terminal cleavage/methylation domain-containing protein
MQRSQHIPNNRSSSGFTLLELLIVVSIIAIIGGLVIFSMGDVRQSVQQRASSYEIRTLHDAIKAFRRDTGYYPKQGPFALTIDGGEIDAANAAHWPNFLSLASTTERQDWFYHPANFYQLILPESPLQGSTHTLSNFRPSTGRGWRGPYIKDGAVRLAVGESAVFNPNTDSHTPSNWSQGSWNGVGATNATNIPVICDAQMGQTVLFKIRQFNELTTLSEYGRPYMYFIATNSVWLVGMGPDREYQGGTSASDDLVLYLSE